MVRLALNLQQAACSRGVRELGGVLDDPVAAALCLAQVLDARKVNRRHPIQWTEPAAVAAAAEAQPQAKAKRKAAATPQDAPKPQAKAKARPPGPQRRCGPLPRVSSSTASPTAATG